MGRDTWFYKLDHKKAKSKLYTDITSDTKFNALYTPLFKYKDKAQTKTTPFRRFQTALRISINRIINRKEGETRNKLDHKQYNLPKGFILNTNSNKSFKTFLIHRNKEVGISADLFDRICNKVHTNINTILPSELFELTFWLGDLCFDLRDVNKEISKELFEDNGLDELLHLHGRTAYGFMFRFGTFTDYFEIEGINEGDDGFNLDHDYFIKFLDFVILLMGKLIEENLEPDYQHEFTNEERIEIKHIEQKYKADSIFFEAIEKEFNYLVNNYKRDNPIHRDPDITAVNMASSYFCYCITMKNSITTSNTNILILDSI